MSARSDWEARRRRRLEDARRLRRKVPLPPDPQMPTLWLYDYDGAASLLNVSPAYVKKLCDQRRITYVVKTYRHGYYRRRVRLIPWLAVREYMLRRLTFMVATASALPKHRDRVETGKGKPAGGRTETGGGGGGGAGPPAAPEG